MSEQTNLATGRDTKNVSTDLDGQWARVKEHLRAELGEATFNSWFSHLNMVAMETGRVALAVPTRFMRDWLQTHYVAHIEKAWAAEAPNGTRVDILVTMPAKPSNQCFAAKPA